MKNKEFYKITLMDCAIPSFCSCGKDYYGTIEEVEDLINGNKKTIPLKAILTVCKRRLPSISPGISNVNILLRIVKQSF